MLNGQFGKSSETVVIEDFLIGVEVSVFIITDGVNYKILPEAKDYKRINENEKYRFQYQTRRENFLNTNKFIAS